MRCEVQARERHGIKLYVLIAFIAFALLTGCGGKSEAGEILARSAEVMNNLDNYKAAVAMNLQMGVTGQTTTVRMVSSMDVFTSPFRAKTLTDVDDVSHNRTYKIDGYVIQDVGNIVLYMKMGNERDNEWVKDTRAFSEDLLSAYSPASYSQLFHDELKKAEITASETIGDIDCWKIEGLLAPTAVIEILKHTNGSQSLAAPFTEETLSGAKDIPVSIWIAQKDHHQIRADLDVTEAMAPELNHLGVNLHLLAFSIATSDFGNAENFTFPEELKDAPEERLY